MGRIPPVIRCGKRSRLRAKTLRYSIPSATHSSSSRPWYEGQAEIRTYALDELLATKLRALYQRRKGRDLFDLWIGLGMKGADPTRIADAFRKYMRAGGDKVSRREFEMNLEAKVALRQFNDDLRPLLAPAIRYDAVSAARVVSEKLLSKL